MMLARLRAAELTATEPGQLLRTCVLPQVTATQLAFYCAAAGVVDPIHYDREFARRFGFSDAVVNGSLRVAWMAQALHELAFPDGWLTRMACSHRGMMLVGQTPRIEIRCQSHTTRDDGVFVDLLIQTMVADTACDQGSGTVLFRPMSSCPHADRP